MNTSYLPILSEDGPRILELGNSPWISLVKPNQSHFIFCGPKRHQHLVNLTPQLAWDLRKKIQRRYYDLVVWSIYYPKGSFWQPGRSSLLNFWIFTRTAIKQFQSIGRELIPWLIKGTNVPLIILDRKDEPPLITSGEFPLLKICNAYFLRECPLQPYAALYNTTRRFGDSANIKRTKGIEDLFRKIYPISLGCRSNDNFVSAVSKKTEIFFAGAVEHSEARIKGIKVLKRLKDEGYMIDTPGYLHDREEFLRRASEAYLVLSPQGLGWDCYRHYEAGYVGSVPVMNYPTIRRYQPLRNGTHAYYYGMEEEEELYELLKALLQDKEELLRVGKRAQEHVLQYHTWDALVKYVLRIALEK